MVLAEDKAVQIDDQQLQLVKVPGRQAQLTGSSRGQFHRESVIMRIRRNSAKRTPGIAKSKRTIVAMPLRPAEKRQRLPPIMPVRPRRMMSHNPILNEDTDPSDRPVKKKYSKTKAISASNPQRSQNFMYILRSPALRMIERSPSSI